MSDDQKDLASQRAGETEGFYTKNDKGDIMIDSGLKAGLRNRYINLIALCGIIGPGVFVGMGTALATCGPAGLLAGFAIVGILVLSMMNSIGELNAFLDRNFGVLGSKIVSPGFGAALNWYYWLIWICNIIQEYTSLTSAMEAYTTTVPVWGWFLIFYVSFTLFQTLDVSYWGALEYVLGFIKLAFLGGYYIFAIVYASGGIHGHNPNNPFGHFPLNGGFRGIANSFVYAGVYYSGVEGVSLIAAEARNPRRAVPTAARNTIFRVFYAYFGLSAAYGITMPYNDPNLSDPSRTMRSPMTIAFAHAGWANGRYFVTTMIWITCFSSINTAIYLASRTLHSMAKQGDAPKIFGTVSKRGVPYVAIHFCHILGFLSLLSISAGSSVAYSYIVNVAGVCCFIVWTAISAIHIRFRNALRVQGISTNILPYKAIFFPWSNWVAIVIGSLLTLVQGWTVFSPFDYKTFIDDYLMLPLFFIIWFLYDKYYYKSGIRKLDEVDLLSGRRPDLDDHIGEDDQLSLDDYDLELADAVSKASQSKRVSPL